MKSFGQDLRSSYPYSLNSVDQKWRSFCRFFLKISIYFPESILRSVLEGWFSCSKLKLRCYQAAHCSFWNITSISPEVKQNIGKYVILNVVWLRQFAIRITRIVQRSSHYKKTKGVSGSTLFRVLKHRRERYLKLEDYCLHNKLYLRIKMYSEIDSLTTLMIVLFVQSLDDSSTRENVEAFEFYVRDKRFILAYFWELSL